jgi:hypothetical protein
VETDHKPVPGPQYWEWRCRVCDKPVVDHHQPVNWALVGSVVLSLAILGVAILSHMR